MLAPSSPPLSPPPRSSPRWWLRLLPVTLVAVALVAAGCSSSSGTVSAGSGADVQSVDGVAYESTGTGPMVKPTIPQTPSVPTDFGQLQCSPGAPLNTADPAPAKRSCTRVFHLTASAFEQKIANFPVQDVTVWGYNNSAPGPTLISYAGEQVQIVVTNNLPVPTTVHPHGLHQPNSADGVAGVSQPDPVMPGQTYTYPAFVPGHTGTFAYHSHTDSAVQELRGLDGAWVVLPRAEHSSVHVNDDYVMTLQQFNPEAVMNGMPVANQLVNGTLDVPFPGGTGDFPFSTINGKTGDASGGPITIHKGDVVRIRIYNASQNSHAMHLHGHDEILVAKNGHAVPPTRETTQNVAPGDFFTIDFKADNPGNWIFHCHFPHHTTNAMESGYNGAPAGMTRIFHYAGYAPVPPQYFTYQGQNSSKAP